MSFTSPNNMINLWDWSAARKWCNYPWIVDISQDILSPLLHYPMFKTPLCIIFTFHIATSSGFLFFLRGCTCTRALMSTIWLDLCLKNFVYPRCSYFPLHPTSIPVIEPCVVWGFRVLLWANLSWRSKAEGPLTPACWLSLHCLPAACFHGYLSSVAGRCSSSLMYDTTSFTKQWCFCVAVISRHPDAFCSPPLTVTSLCGAASVIRALSGGQQGKNDSCCALFKLCEGGSRVHRLQGGEKWPSV